MNEPKICEWCGREFIPLTTRNVTCSNKCSTLRRAHKSKLRNRKVRNSNEIKLCVECGKPLPPEAHLNATICSDACKHNRHRRLSRAVSLKKRLDAKGLKYTEENYEEVAKANGIQVPKPYGAYSRDFKSREQIEAERIEMAHFSEEMKAHKAFRASIKRETIAKDEAAARELGVSYGEYIAFYKGRNKK